MTADDVAEVLAIVAMHWPNSRLGANPTEAQGIWLAELAEFDREDVEAAVRRLLGREWAPAAGQVAAEVRSGLQGSPPPFDEVGTAMMRAQHWLPYDPEGRYSPADTARAVAVLADRGVHESILRFIEERGLRAVLTMPWGHIHPLDRNQSADHRDLARHFRDVSVDGWRRDPRPGIALERACRTAQLNPGQLLELVAGERRDEQARLEKASRRAVALLPAAATAGTDDDGELVDFDLEQMLAHYRAERSRAEAQRATERAEKRAADAVAYRAAEAELAEHNARTATTEALR